MIARFPNISIPAHFPAALRPEPSHLDSSRWTRASRTQGPGTAGEQSCPRRQDYVFPVRDLERSHPREDPHEPGTTPDAEVPKISPAR